MLNFNILTKLTYEIASGSGSETYDKIPLECIVHSLFSVYAGGGGVMEEIQSSVSRSFLLFIG